VREKMQAELGRPPNEHEAHLIDAVVARFPKAEEGPAEKPLSAWVLVAANLVPLAGVLFWGWDAFALIVLFWMENVVVGVFFVLRMLSLDPRDPALWAAKLFMVPFFCVHYGMFTAIHGVFVFALLGAKRYDVQGLWVLEPAARAATDYGLGLPVAVLVASHLFSFAWNYLYRGEFRRAKLTELMARPYARVVVLLAMKIGLDLKAHVKEHSTT